jgi:hypothetical protein
MSKGTIDPFRELAARQSAPKADVLGAIKAEMKADEKPKRALSRGERVALSALGLCLGLCLTSFSALEVAPRALFLSTAALCLSASGLILAGAVPGATSRLGGVSGRRLLFAVLFVAGFSTLALQAESFVSMESFLSGDSVHHATTCASHSLLSGVVGASVLMLIWRRTDPFSPGLTGGILGLVGGALGTISVGLLCKSTEGFHLTLAHGFGLLALAVLGTLVGRKWLSP